MESPGGPDTGRGAATEVLYESATTRVVRCGNGRVLKTPLAFDAAARLAHERGILQHLHGVAGIAHLAAGSSHATQLELADGGTSLAHILASRTLAVAEVVRIACELASVLDAIHAAGVIHRDINPANILMGEAGSVVIADFDLAIRADGEQPAHAAGAVGTLGYAAPEQFGRTARPVDRRADLYALGATLYHLATGRAPFDGGDALALMHDHLVREPAAPASIEPAVPRALSDIILRLLAKEPDQRYHSAAGLAHDLALVRAALAAGRDAAFALGERDFPPRLAPPSQLVGREDELAILRQAFAEAMTAERRALLLEGAAGVGKSALIDQLRPLVHAAGGWYVYGKFDQLQRKGAASAGTQQALRSLGRQLLALPRDEAQRHRHEILQALGGNAALLTRIVPEFAVLLGEQVDASSADPQREEGRVMEAMVDMLCAVASPQRPLVLVLDDLHWAGEQSLRAFERIAFEPRMRGLLLVGAYRGNELSEGDALSALLARSAGRHLAVANLGRAGLAALVGQMLRLGDGRAQELAGAVHVLTDGNPLQTVEVLNGLRGAGVVRLAPEGWQWDDAAVRRFIGQGDVAQLVAARIRQLPQESRRLLECMSCLGSFASVRLLAVAAHMDDADVEALVQPPIAAGLAAFERDANGVVRFTHDTVQEVAQRMMDEGARHALQLEMARHLARSARFELHAAQQYLQCDHLVTDRGEKRQVARLFAAMATSLMAAANFALAERYLAGAASHAPDDAELHLAIAIDHHKALYSLGRLAQAEALFAQIEQLASQPEQLADAARLQMRAFDILGREVEGRALGARLLAQLGLELPAEDDEAQFRERLDGLAAWVQRERQVGTANLVPISDGRLLAAAKMLSQCVMSAWTPTGGRDFARFLLGCQKLWADHGPSPALAAILGRLTPLLITLDGGYRVAFDVARHVLEVSEAQGWEPETSLARQIYSAYACHWFLPLEECQRQTARAVDGIVAHGDVAYACYVDLAQLWLQMTCTETLDAAERQLELGMARSQRTGNTLSLVLNRIQGSALRTLRSDAPDHWGMEEARIRHRMGQLAWVDGTIDSARGFAAMLMGDFDLLTGYCADADAGAGTHEDKPGGIDVRPTPGHLWNPHFFLAGAVALAWQLRREPGVEAAQRTARLARTAHWFAQRAADNPGNYLHLARLVDAELAWALQDRWKAAAAFDEALTAVQQVHRPWHRALIAEHAALFHLEQGTDYAGRALMQEAHAGYAAWGASAKVQRMEREHPWLPPLRRRQVSVQPVAGSGTTADTLDLMAVLRASHVLSSETSLSRLAVRLTEVIAALTGATDVCLLTLADAGWMLLVPLRGGEQLRLAGIDEAAREGCLPASAFHYAERTGETLRIADAAADPRFASDPYFAGMPHCSLMVLPIAGQGATRAMVVATHRRVRGAFGAERADAALLIAGQLAVSLANAQLYASLEERVRARTDELQKTQATLVATARRAGMAEIASNVLHNVGNVLNSTTVAATVLGRQLRELKVESLDRVVALMDEHAADIGSFFADDERGRMIPRYLADLARALEEQRRVALEEVETVLRSVNHMHGIVRSQQTYAGASSFIEEVDAAQVVEEALEVDAAAAPQQDVHVHRQFEALPRLALDRQRVLMILVNLIGNAREAMHGVPAEARKLMLGVAVDRSSEREVLCMTVRDAGCGIDQANLAHIFSHGFTTKPQGHGFGLHSCALAALEMGGKLHVHSDGPGTGATFTLRLPLGAQVGIQAPG